MSQNQVQLQFSIFDPNVVIPVLNRLQESYPHMAQSVAMFYMIVDETCERINKNSPVFLFNNLQYQIIISGIEPLLENIMDGSGQSDGVVIGANIHLSIINEYISKPDPVGQLRILLGSNGDSDYSLFMYLDLSSLLITTDSQIIKLKEWLSIIRFLVEREIGNTMKSRSQASAQPRPTQEPSASNIVNRQRPEQTMQQVKAPKKNKITAEKYESKKQPQVQQPQPQHKLDIIEEDPFSSITKQNIPAFNINMQSEKMNVTKDVFNANRNNNNKKK